MRVGGKCGGGLGAVGFGEAAGEVDEATNEVLRRSALISEAESWAAKGEAERKAPSETPTMAMRVGIDVAGRACGRRRCVARTSVPSHCGKWTPSVMVADMSARSVLVLIEVVRGEEGDASTR